MAILDPKTGELEYINAGHNPPLLSVRGKDFEFLEAPPGFVMGSLEGYAYHASKAVMHPGDMLFLYTDGVTEAMNARGELFGNERTTEALNNLKGKPVREVIRGMREAIDGFIQGAPASDDVTMLAVSLTGISIPDVLPSEDTTAINGGLIQPPEFQRKGDV
jgi:phosphoserine phosphatase RsbU/P